MEEHEHSDWHDNGDVAIVSQMIEWAEEYKLRRRELKLPEITAPEHFSSTLLMYFCGAKFLTSPLVQPREANIQLDAIYINPETYRDARAYLLKTLPIISTTTRW